MQCEKSLPLMHPPPWLLARGAREIGGLPVSSAPGWSGKEVGEEAGSFHAPVWAMVSLGWAFPLLRFGPSILSVKPGRTADAAGVSMLSG